MKRSLVVILLLLLGALHAFAQDRTITGTVTDRVTSEPLPGVTVLVKGTSVGTATGPDGTFTLQAPASATTLQFRFVGYVQQEQAIADGPMSVTLVTDTKQLGEVVVTALGIEKEKRSLGYSTQTIEAAQLTQGRDRSVLNSLQGKVAGVQINNTSGGVGSSTRIVIRGNKSLLGNNQPLFVIDGVPVSNDAIGTGDNLNNGVDAGNRANDINPEDVESVNVLKGPAATALYGSRAANGAIVITTKSGRNAAKRGKKAEVTFTTSYTADQILRLPKFQNEFGQGTSPDQADTRENWSWGPRFDGVVRPWGQIVNNQQRYKPYVGLKDNVKEFFDIGHTFINTLSAGGGNEKSNYYLSVSNTDQKGVTPTTRYKRTSVKLSGETKLTNKFTTSGNITYTRSGGDLAVTGQGASVYDQIIQTPRDISLLELKDLNNPFNTVNGYYGAYTENPWQILHDNYYRNDVDRIFGNVQLGYNFNDHFRVNYRIGSDVYADRRRQFTAKLNPIGQNSGIATPGSYSEAQYTYTELTSDLIATYNTNLTEDLTLSALVGHQLNQRRRDALGFETNRLVNNNIPGFENNGGQFANSLPGVTTPRFLRRLYGVYGTVDLGFRNYLFLNLSARNDWSSTLPKNNRSFFYPSVGTSFVFTDLLGLQDNTVFNYGKLRASYAQAGNDADPYQTLTYNQQTSIESGYTGTTVTAPFNGVPAYELGNTIGNPQLKPEITKSYEFGTELRFFNNRLTIDASYYDANSTNQIIPVPISTASGYRSRVVNAGSIRNRGIELLVGGTPVKVGDFTWDLSVNFTKNKNKVEELYEGVKEIVIPGGIASTSLVATLGDPYGNLKSEAILYSPTGQMVVDPTTGLPRQDPELRIQGNIQPKWSGGLNSTMSYRGLSLAVVFDTKQGGKMYSRTRAIQRFVGTDPTTLYNDRRPFIAPNSVVENGDGTYSPSTTPVAVWDYWGQLPDGTNIIDASYVKLREVSLSYSLPSKWLDKLPFGNISVGLTGRNLFLWTPAENTYVDPEANNFGNGNLQGFDFTGSPSLRSYGANLRVTF